MQIPQAPSSVLFGTGSAGSGGAGARCVEARGAGAGGTFHSQQPPSPLTCQVGRGPSLAMQVPQGPSGFFFWARGGSPSQLPPVVVAEGRRLSVQCKSDSCKGS